MSIESAPSVTRLSAEIGDGGLPMGRIAVRPWGERSFYLHDPWGNLVELNEPGA